jgi:transcription initiation factor TFIIB
MTSHTFSNRSKKTHSVIDLAEKLSTPVSVTTVADTLYQQVYDEELYHGRKQELVLGGVLYVAARSINTSVSPDRIATELGVETKQLLATVRYFMRNLDIPLPPITPETYIETICDDCELESAIKQSALELSSQLIESSCIYSGKSPRGFASGIVYLTAKLQGVNLTQSAISDVIDVSEVTIRKRYKEQYELYKTLQ